MSKRKSSQPHSPRTTMFTTSASSRSYRSSTSIDLVAFYTNTTPDARGRFLSQILRWDASRLESSHDYIQTVFPLPETSGVNWDAPVIDKRVFDAFREREELRDGLRESFRRILWFYGFVLEHENGEYKVTKGPNYSLHHSNWDSRFDHNHLRITRIIRCLRVLGLEKEARAFYEALLGCYTRVSERSREFWRRAAERGLNLRPDLEIEDEGNVEVGLGFLREFEVERKKVAEDGKGGEDGEDAEAAEGGLGEAEDSAEKDTNAASANSVDADGPIHKSDDLQEGDASSWEGFEDDAGEDKVITNGVDVEEQKSNPADEAKKLSLEELMFR